MFSPKLVITPHPLYGKHGSRDTAVPCPYLSNKRGAIVSLSPEKYFFLFLCVLCAKVFQTNTIIFQDMDIPSLRDGLIKRLGDKRGAIVQVSKISIALI